MFASKTKLLTSFLLLLAASSLLYGNATLTTDATDYSANSTVHITGSGWIAGETVSLLLQSASGMAPITSATVATGGSIDTSLQAGNKDTYYLTATGAKAQAQVTFTVGGGTNGIIRNYTILARPSATLPSASRVYTFDVTNRLDSGQTNTIGSVILSAPAGFTVTAASIVSPASGWIYCINTANCSPAHNAPANAARFEVSSGSEISPAGHLIVTVTATAPSSVVAPNCVGDKYTWGVSVSQGINNGAGNDFTQIGTSPVVTVFPPGCFADTALSLVAVPGTVGVNTHDLVNLTAVLSSFNGSVWVPVGAGETVNFESAGFNIGQADTDVNGQAVLPIHPDDTTPSQVFPLAAGDVQFLAKFLGDNSVAPQLIPTVSDPATLHVTAVLSSLAVDPAEGPYGGSVDLSATLTHSGTAIAGATVNFMLNGTSVGSAITNTSGVASLSNVSLSGIAVGTYGTGVGASFAGNATYTSATGSAQLKVNALTPTVTVSGGPFTYDTNPHAATCTVTGANAVVVAGTCVLTYTPPGDTTVPVNANTYAVAASFTSSDANYGNATGAGTLTISPAGSTTVVTCPADATYTGSALTPCTANVTGVGGLNQAVTVTYSNNTDAGTATANATYPGDSNHSGSSDSKTFTILQASSTTTITCPASVTYNGTAQTPCTATVTGAGGLNQSVTVTYGNNTNAGTATADATYAGDANHAGSSDSKTFAIEKAKVTTTAGSYSGTYDGSSHPPTPACAVTGTYTGDLTCTNDPPTVGPEAGSGTVTPSVSGTGLNNFDVTAVDGHWDIGQASSATTVTCPANVTYTGAALTPCTATVTGAGALNQPVTVNYSNNVNAGTATATATFAGDANHTGSTDTKTFAIDKAPSTTTVTGGTFVYNGAPHAATVSVTGAGGLNTTGTPTYSGTCTSAPITVAEGVNCTASYTYPGDSNHLDSTGSAKVTITQRALTVTANNATKIYGDPVPTLTGVLTGVVAGDSITATYSTTATDSSPISPPTYPITAALLDPNNKLPNYSVTNTPGELTVTKRPASVIPNAVSIYWNQSDPPLTGTLTGFLPADNVSATYSRQSGTEPGTYLITVNQPISGNNLGNYDITYGTALFTINKRPTQVTVTVSPNSGIYANCYDPGSPIVITATLWDITPGAPPTSLAGQVVALGLGTQSILGLPPTDVNGMVSGSLLQLLQNVGTVQAYGTFAATNHYAGSTGTAPFTVYPNPNVGPEDGQPLYIGSNYFWTTSPNSNTATLTLSAALKDTGSSPTCHGDISTALVTFAVRTPGSTAFKPIPKTVDTPVGLVVPTDTTEGTATAIAQYTIGSDSEDVDIAIIVGGNYILNDVKNDAIIHIAKPGAATAITGSVMLNLAGAPAASGYLANNNPGVAQLNADVHYNKSKTNAQGSVNVTFDSYNTLDGKPSVTTHTYYIKSTSIAEVTFKQPNLSTLIVSFSAKANVRDMSAGGNVDSATTLQVTVTKDLSASPQPDQVSIMDLGKSGGLWMASGWANSNVVQKSVSDGSLSVNLN